MELTWTTEKSEEEAIKLFWRRHSVLASFNIWVFASVLVLWLAVLVRYQLGFLADSVYEIVSVYILVVCLLAFVTTRLIERVVRRTYRQRGTFMAEYRLTDDLLSFAAGDMQFSSPWNKVAKKFRIDKKAIYLYGKDMPFEAQCIPDWRGHGVEKKELVAALKKAGLKKVMNGWLKCLIVLVALPVLFTIYFYIGGIEWGDWTIPNEADLRLELCDVPDAENAYLALQALTNLYHVAKNGDETATISDKTFARYYGNPFFTDGDNYEREKWAAARRDPSAPKRAARILAENAEFFKSFRGTLSLKKFTDVDTRLWNAKMAKGGKPPWVYELPLYKPFIDFAQLVVLRAQVILEQGDVVSAVSDIDQIHGLGQLVMANNESMIAYLVGAMIEEYSYWKMCDVVALGKATDEIIELFSKMLVISEANAPMAWERGLKAEITRHFEGVEWVCKHPDLIFSWMLNANALDSLDPSPSFVGKILSGWPGYAKFAFHRREMLYRQAMLGRTMLAGDEDLTEMIEHEIPRNPLSPNFAGNVLVAGSSPRFGSFAKEKCMNRIRPRLVIAAEKWRRAHGGENPPSLDALVPDYLAAVPRDPWSQAGEPIKYDAALGVAWSVGEEGRYDYRKIVKDHATESKTSVDGDTQKYAFCLDGKPVELR